MPTERRASYTGICANCAMRFGADYPLSAHETNCWGRDGKTPHALNPALAPDELRHRRQAATAKAAISRAAKAVVPNLAASASA